jgi:RHS repeat-associated protein
MTTDGVEMDFTYDDWSRMIARQMAGHTSAFDCRYHEIYRDNCGSFIFGNTGQILLDAVSDYPMYYAPFRNYSPNSARWTTRDPLGFSQGQNKYGYVGGHPIAYSDPDGRGLVGNIWKVCKAVYRAVKPVKDEVDDVKDNIDAASDANSAVGQAMSDAENNRTLADQAGGDPDALIDVLQHSRETFTRNVGPVTNAVGKPVLDLVPGAGAQAANILNDHSPAGNNGKTDDCEGSADGK